MPVATMFENLGKPERASMRTRPTVDGRDPSIVVPYSCASWMTRIRPRCRLRGFDLTTISTSCPSFVRSRMSRSLEKLVRRPFNSAETLGWSIPITAAAATCVRRCCRTISRIRVASCAFANASSGSGTPMSAKTLPEPGVTLMDAFFATGRSPLLRVRVAPG